MRSARAPVVLLLATLLLAVAATAQVPSPTGNLYGQVLDEQGKTLPGIAITLAGPGAALAAVTDAKGDFHFLSLSPGAYSVTLELKGFETVHRDVTVSLGKNAVLLVTMPVAGAAETVSVRSEVAAQDSRKTETGATYGQKELQSIPTTRDVWAVLRQVPAVLLNNINVGGEDSGNQSAFVGKGSHSDQNTYNLDGVGITLANGQTPVYFNFDSLDNIEVATGGSDPSLPTPGVTLNLVTKRGTNQVLGSARALYAESAGWDYGVEAGGPLWKDRLWLWGAFGHLAFVSQQGFTRTGDPVESQPIIGLWNGKLNAQLAPANALVFSYINSDKENSGQLAGLNHSQPSSWDQMFTTAAYRVEDSEVWSANLFTSLELAYLSSKTSQPAQGGFEAEAILDQYGVWRNSFVFHSARQPQYQAGLNTSSFFDTGDLRHELKFGFGYKHLSIDSLTSWPGGGLVGDEQARLAAITRSSSLRWEANTYGTFIGDTIQAGNLTVNVGARFDYQQAKNLPSAVPANPIFPKVLPAVQYGGDSGYPITWRQFQPRLGATYALGSNRKTLLRASYSRFANRLGTEVTLINAFPGTQGIYYAWDDPNGNHHVDPGEIDPSQQPIFAIGVDPNNPGLPVPVNQIERNFKPPTTDEFIVGVEREILSGLSAALAYTYRSTRNSEFLYNSYIPLVGTSRSSYQYVGNAVGSATAADGLVLNFNEPYYRLMMCPPPCAGAVFENRPDFTETYSGLELQLVKRLSHGWAARASFAYNDWQQHVGPGAIIDPNNATGGVNASGPAVDSTGINSNWQFNVSGLVQLPFGIDASANFFGRQGFPVLYNVQVITGDAITNFFEDPFIQIGSVGAHRLPDIFLLDLHVEKAFRVGSAVTVSPMVDCFNVANSHTVLQRDGFVGTYDANATPAFTLATDSEGKATFSQAVQFLNSRVFRGGVRVAF
jgi:hypothetical protein